MKLEDQNILFLTRSMGLGGTENVILQLCEILKDRVNTFVTIRDEDFFDDDEKSYFYSFTDFLFSFTSTCFYFLCLMETNLFYSFIIYKTPHEE